MDLTIASAQEQLSAISELQRRILSQQCLKLHDEEPSQHLALIKREALAEQKLSE